MYTEPLKTIQNFTTSHKNTNKFTTLHKLHNIAENINNFVVFFNLSYKNFPKTKNTMNSSTQLYNTLHNFTTTLTNFAQLNIIVQTNST